MYVVEGSPNQVEKHLKVFFTKRNYLSTEQGSVLWGTRVGVPSQMGKAVLNEIHLGHKDLVQTKAPAHKFVWWPNNESDVEQMSKDCETCPLVQKKKPQNVTLRYT